MAEKGEGGAGGKEGELLGPALEPAMANAIPTISSPRAGSLDLMAGTPSICSALADNCSVSGMLMLFSLKNF